jgi:hypothetical protein
VLCRLNLGSGPLGPDAPRPLLTCPLCPFLCFTNSALDSGNGHGYIIHTPSDMIVVVLLSCSDNVHWKVKSEIFQIMY